WRRCVWLRWPDADRPGDPMPGHRQIVCDPVYNVDVRHAVHCWIVLQVDQTVGGTEHADPSEYVAVPVTGEGRITSNAEREAVIRKHPAVAYLVRQEETWQRRAIYAGTVFAIAVPIARYRHVARDAQHHREVRYAAGSRVVLEIDQAVGRAE